MTIAHSHDHPAVMQDRIDDRVVGVKSTALYFEDQVKTWLSGEILHHSLR